MIRPATADDADILARLRYEFRASLATVEERDSDFLPRCARWIRERLEAGSQWNAWLAHSAGSPVGTIWLQWIEKIPNPVTELEWHGYITSLFVRESFRGNRLGTALLETALAACRTRGVDAVILWPTPRSRSLYLRHGFSVQDDLMQLR
ncbi:MAG TPA: GNAT family N-acetyltransferase [Gemmatimonadales bacterium]|nr:GNAT family N-acetyltransferase [Gemmatimonadales bacterium]